MYSKKCIVKLVVHDAKLMDTLKIASTSTKIIRFKSIEWCGAKNLSSKVKKYCSFSLDESGLSSPSLDSEYSDYNMSSLYLVYVKCRLVGIKNLEFSFDLPYSRNFSEVNADTLKFVHMVVVARPERFIDHILLVYVVFFSCVMSIIMGILLDIKTLLKIIQMPVPVLIGFCSQYLCMPLVRVFTLHVCVLVLLLNLIYLFLKLSFIFIKFFTLDPAEALALFIYGCSPGGSGSNNWSAKLILSFALNNF